MGTTQSFETTHAIVDQDSWYDRVRHTVATQLYDEHQALLKDAGIEYVTDITGFKSDDLFLIVDMQNDFLPTYDAPCGGRCACTEGHAAAMKIVDIMDKVIAAKCLCVATRDYHPKDHCSFDTQGGPFQEHCLQGHVGTYFYPPIKRALQKSIDAGVDTRVVFKGFCKSADTYGNFAYRHEYFVSRGLKHNTDTQPSTMLHGTCALNWTGSFALQCSNLQEDLNAPPDVMAVFDRKPLAEVVRALGDKAPKRLIAVGLAFDFCVLDSCINAVCTGLFPEGVYLVVDASRAIHVPGVGGFGTGFVSDPKSVVQKAKEVGIEFVYSAAFGAEC